MGQRCGGEDWQELDEGAERGGEQHRCGPRPPLAGAPNIIVVLAALGIAVLPNWVDLFLLMQLTLFASVFMPLSSMPDACQQIVLKR